MISASIDTILLVFWLEMPVLNKTIWNFGYELIWAFCTLCEMRSKKYFVDLVYPTWPQSFQLFQSWFYAFTFLDEKSIEELVPNYFTRLLFGLLLLPKRQRKKDQPFGEVPELLHRLVPRESRGLTWVHSRCRISTIKRRQKIKNPWRSQWNSYFRTYWK